MPRNVSTILYMQSNLALNTDVNITPDISYSGNGLTLSNVKLDDIPILPFIVNNPINNNGTMRLVKFEVFLRPPGGVKNSDPTEYPGLFDSVRRQFETSDVINFTTSKVTHRPFASGFGATSKSIVELLNSIASVNRQLPQNIDTTWGLTFNIGLDTTL
jgi:hypothetical protein